MKNNNFRIHLTTEELDLQHAASFLTIPEAGGVDIFIGTTRQWTDGVETARLEYDGYLPLAEKEIERLIESAFEKWNVLRVCVFHRLGGVPVAKASVIIGVAAAHRAPAFEACRFLIDSLKTQVPIWKREMFTDGTTAWVEGDSLPSVTEKAAADDA